MENTVPPLPSPDEPGIPAVSAQGEGTDHFAEQRFERSRPAHPGGTLLSVGGVGLFCLSLLLPWFSQYYDTAGEPLETV